MNEGSYKKQVGGTHYLRMGIQPWQVIDANNLNYYEGCVLKYLLRRKPGVERVVDLRKAIHCIEHMIEAELDATIESLGVRLGSR